MTSIEITAAAKLIIGLLFIWSMVEMVRLMLPETGRIAKTKKAVAMHRIIASLAGTLGLTAIMAIFSPPFRGTLGLIGIYALIQFFNLLSKRKRLEREITALHQTESILSLSLGTHNKIEGGVPIKLWFKSNGADWPKADLEVGVGIHSLPVEQAHRGILEKLVLPRITDAMNSAETEETQTLLSNLRADFQEAGITHPLDINGWDKNPVIKAFLEKVFEAPPLREAVAT